MNHFRAFLKFSHLICVYQWWLLLNMFVHPISRFFFMTINYILLFSFQCAFVVWRFFAHLVYHSVNFNEEHKILFSFQIKINIITAANKQCDIHSAYIFFILPMLKIKNTFILMWYWTKWKKNCVIQEHINFNAHETQFWKERKNVKHKFKLKIQITTTRAK